MVEQETKPLTELVVPRNGYGGSYDRGGLPSAGNGRWVKWGGATREQINTSLVIAVFFKRVMVISTKSIVKLIILTERLATERARLVFQFRFAP